MYNNTTQKKILEERKKLLEYIKKHPNKLIKVDKELLDSLIFSYNYAIGYNKTITEYPNINLKGIDINNIENYLKDTNKIKQNSILVKIPVWTGTFLRHIDLSEIDFSNCLWDPEVLTEYEIIWYDSIDDLKYELQETNIPEQIDEETFNKNYVDLSYTNANIDFNKSFSAKVFKDQNTLYNCNFEGLDLSKSNTQTITSIYNCNLQNSNFKINEEEFFAFCSNLKDMDLSEYETIYSSGVEYSESFTHLFDYCNLENTRIKIHVIPSFNGGADYYLKQFGKLLDKGYFTNCNLNLHYFDINTYEDDDLDEDFPYKLH